MTLKPLGDGYTPDHSFFINSEWQEIGYAQPGDQLLQPNGYTLTIDSLTFVADTSVQVFNFTVEGNHNYFAEGVLVHNCDWIRRTNKNTQLPKLGIPYFDNVADLSKVSNSQFVSYAKQIERLYDAKKLPALSRDQAAILVSEARRRGIYVRIDKGHKGSKWDMDHLNIGGKTGDFHVPFNPK